MKNKSDFNIPRELLYEYSQSHLVRIGEMLHIKDEQQIKKAAEAIHTTVVTGFIQINQDRKIPNRRDGRNKLDAISKATLKLIYMLKDFDLTNHGTGFIEGGSPEIDGMIKMFYRKSL